ncbi:MAG: hypothetical protein WBG46_11585 [Nonlabens sp.]
MSRLSLLSFIIFYAFAGVMHFVMPELYIQVIPKQLGNAELLNYLAGAFEILIAVLALFRKTRDKAGFSAIAMLFVFIIPHIYFIQMGSCAGELCIPEWIGWIRLIMIHPLLLYWAYAITKNQIKIL